MINEDLKILEEQVTTIISEHLDLIAVNAKSIANAKERAAKFLVVQSVLSTILKVLEDDISRSTTVKEASYAQAIGCSEGKNITEKKLNAVSNANYTETREFNEHLDAMKTWIKTHIKIFDNAHILYRQYGNER